MSRFDYAADVCKDYKEAGYCGFGDNCKFMHDRGDYKTGFQLEKEWELQQKEDAKRKEALWIKSQNEVKVESETEDDGIPLNCPICELEFTYPIITLCKHCFCESCAIKHHKKSKGKCFTCQCSTLGSFNVAKDIIQKLLKKEEGVKERTRKIREEIGDEEF